MTRLRPCADCGVDPIAYAGRKYCYGCVPRVWKRPPRCKLCGSEEDYFTAGRCRGCHRQAPVLDSCTDCLAWGVTRRRAGRCQGCQSWRVRFGHSTTPCLSCGRDAVVNGRGHCRLCCRQAHLVRVPHQSGDVAVANRHGQQLFLVDLFRQKRPEPPASPTRTAPWPARYPVAHRQLLIWPAGLDPARDLPAGRRAGLGAPPLPDLLAALEQVLHDHAGRYGWRDTLTSTVGTTIRILLSTQDTPGAPIPISHASAVTTTLGLRNLTAVCEVLTDAGMLDDDREPPLESWFTRQVAPLAEPMAEEVRLWFTVLRDGSTTPPRSRPRNIHTVRAAVTRVTPALRAWTAAGHRSLREISRQDVLDVLPTVAHQQRQALTALRSLFRLLKARRIIFANPTARLRGAPEQPTYPQPLDLQGLRDALDSDNPARSALAALVAFHAVRNQQLRTLQLTDISDGRLHLPHQQQAIPLAVPVRERVARWLDERARRWPATINPHLFINSYTAVRTAPVSAFWIITALGGSVQAIREDRILHEAQASGGDIRRLYDLFGLGTEGARRYTDAVN